MSKISVSSCFDGGNGEFVGVVSGTPTEIHVNVKNDLFTALEKVHHKQWFYFRVSGCRGTKEHPEHKFVLANAGSCSYPKAWEGYNVCASYNHKDWFRVPTQYDAAAGHLHWTMNVTSDQVYFAYFAPYSHERHLDLLAGCSALASSPHPSLTNKTDVTVRSLGNTLDGRSLDLVSIGSGPLNVWAIARQHPGETMAEFFMEGYMHRLLDENDPIARNLRRAATFHCVPNMNPDGSFRGHLRTNACGANLNREWCSTGDYTAPTLERSPEVFHVLAEMDRVGCDMCLDVHGDETLPYNFLSGSEGVPKWGARLKLLQDSFSDAYKKASPDFQSEFGYEVDPPGEGNLALASNQIGERYDCLAFTFEMPFKDTIADPNPVTGWSPERCQRLGAAVLDAVGVVMPMLRS